MTRPKSPVVPREADERATLLSFLNFYRAELIDRAYGLSNEQLQIALPPSSLTLSRLIGHMTLVEYGWFQDTFDNDGVPPLYTQMDWDSDPDAEMTLAQTWPTERLLQEFLAAVTDSDRRIAQAAALDEVSAKTDDAGHGSSLRWILLHMIEEYARHCGHADFIRESIDGDQAKPPPKEHE